MDKDDVAEEIELAIAILEVAALACETPCPLLYEVEAVSDGCRFREA